MIKLGSLTASQLRLILAISMFVIALLAAVGFSLINSELKKYAVEVSHVTADAAASRDNLQNLQKIEKQLKEDQDIVQKTNSIVAESQSYQYQDQIITDINDYATKAGIAITDINFAAQTTAPSATTPSTPTPSGVKSSTVRVTLKNPINYANLLRFIKSIEQNLTKMQVSSVNLSKDVASGGVSSDILTLQVYVR
jgi:hypothetical protein